MLLGAALGSVLGCGAGIAFAMVAKDAGITPPIFGFAGGTLIGAVFGGFGDRLAGIIRGVLNPPRPVPTAKI